jgi:PleD family two-component response regulator
MVETNEILNVLVVRDDRSIVQELESKLPFNYRILAAQNVAEAKERLSKSAYQILVCYESLSDQPVVDLLAESRMTFPHIVRILVSQKTDAVDVINAIDKASIFKYLIDPEFTELENALGDAAEYYFLKTEGLYTDSVTQLKTSDVILDMLEMELHRSQRYDGDFSAMLLQVVASESSDGGPPIQTDPVLLKEIADIVQAELRTSDVAGRLNDNSCLVLLNNANRQGMGIFSDRLLKKVERLKSEYENETISFDVKLSIYSLNGERDITTEDIIEKLQAQT